MKYKAVIRELVEVEREIYLEADSVSEAEKAMKDKDNYGYDSFSTKYSVIQRRVLDLHGVK